MHLGFVSSWPRGIHQGRHVARHKVEALGLPKGTAESGVHQLDGFGPKTSPPSSSSVADGCRSPSAGGDGQRQARGRCGAPPCSGSSPWWLAQVSTARCSGQAIRASTFPRSNSSPPEPDHRQDASWLRSASPKPQLGYRHRTARSVGGGRRSRGAAHPPTGRPARRLSPEALGMPNGCSYC